MYVCVCVLNETLCSLFVRITMLIPIPFLMIKRQHKATIQAEYIRSR